MPVPPDFADLKCLAHCRRILVLGNSGSGKSTLSRWIGEQRGLPVVHLDQHFWQPGWTMLDRDLWNQKVPELVAGESWICDGNFDSSLPVRLRRADGVILFNLPVVICLWRIFKRVIQDYGRTRADLAEGCPEQFDWEFIKWVANFPRAVLPATRQILRQHAPGIPVVEIRHGNDLTAVTNSIVKFRP